MSYYDDMSLSATQHIIIQEHTLKLKLPLIIPIVAFFVCKIAHSVCMFCTTVKFVYLFLAIESAIFWKV